MRPPQTMKSCGIFLSVVAGLLSGGCASKPVERADAGEAALQRVLTALNQRFAPDGHLAVYRVGIGVRNNSLVLTGEVGRVEARWETLRAADHAGVKVVDAIKVLPDAALGELTWGITTLSVANGREATSHTAELGTQTLLGEVVRVLKRQGRWLYVQSADAYLSWMESGSVKLVSQADADAWSSSPLVTMTEFEAVIREAPQPDAPVVSDAVIGGRVKQMGIENGWVQVELPDGRAGYLPGESVVNFADWRATRQPSAENIERTARSFLGRPYLWGANTPRGMDCSGFTKLTFFLNGIELRRNASQQAREGVEVPLDRKLSQLRKGDLLFFGFERPNEGRGRISHTGIYLGDGLFIQSSGRVRISSLDPDSPIADAARIRGLVGARRVLREY